MIEFHSEIDFKLTHLPQTLTWISEAVTKMDKTLGNINYIFCDDEYLLKINQKYLDHDTYTDIISFDYSKANQVAGDIFISIDRIKENASKFKVGFEEELHRVLIHGVLHFAGFKDKSVEDKKEMRKQEDYYLSLRTF